MTGNLRDCGEAG